MGAITKQPVGNQFQAIARHRILHTRLPLAPTARTVCSPKAKLIIELDGSQHLEQEEYDQERTEFLEEQGYKVIRFWNNEVMNDIEGVILVIMDALEDE